MDIYFSAGCIDMKHACASLHPETRMRPPVDSCYGDHRRIAHTVHRRHTRRCRLSIMTSAALVPGSDSNRVIIVGAGLSGLSAAAALHKVGVPVVVLEREAQLPTGGTAISLWANAFRALDALGVSAPLRDAHPLLERIELCSRDGRLLRSFEFERDCEGGPHEARGMRRSEILAAMTATLPRNTIRFDAQIDSVSSNDVGAVATLSTGEEIRGAVVVGADGVRSAVGASLGNRPPNYAGYSAYRGLATFNEELPLPLNTIRQVWGEGVRAGLYPISEREVYWFTGFNTPSETGPSSPEDRKEEAYDMVKGWPFGVSEAVAATAAADVSRGRVGDRWTMPGAAYGKGNVTLAGDAAHPMTPNLGQGGCTAIEDGIILARHLKPLLSANACNDAAGIMSALREYEKQRSSRCFKITLRSALFGQALQIPFAPVCAIRNKFVASAFSPAHFLDHASFDCGSLDA